MGGSGSKAKVGEGGDSGRGSAAPAAPGSSNDEGVVNQLAIIAPHPELTNAKNLPRGIARWWNLHLLKGVFAIACGAAGTKGKKVMLDGCSLFLHHPEPRDGGGGGDVAARKLPSLLHLHGGGLIFGDARQDDVFVRSVVEELGIIVASAQYRCAPQHPFPTPLDDVEQAFVWLAQHPDVDPDRIMVSGGSAGGHLAAALCQRLNAQGAKVRPCFQVLSYPMLDDQLCHGTGPNDDKFRIWDRTSNVLGWKYYLRGVDAANPPPFAVPARTEDLAGLPPAWIGVGTLDLFHAESKEYAERLRLAGVAVEYVEVDGAYHGFDNSDAQAEVSKRFMRDRMAAMAKHLGR